MFIPFEKTVGIIFKHYFTVDRELVDIFFLITSFSSSFAFLSFFHSFFASYFHSELSLRQTMRRLNQYTKMSSTGLK